jgi:outer membrane protein OmpA-like peptidoglycan-associated protein
LSDGTGKECGVLRLIMATAVLAVLSAPLAGQRRARQFEFGAFGAYTRYDSDFNIDPVFGGGARFGYYLTANIELEADVLFQSLVEVPGSPSSFEPLIGGASLVLNLPVGSISTLYAAAGYSRLDFGTTNPYRFTDGGFHGGAGLRLSLGRRAAVRIEGRAIFSPTTGMAGATAVQHLVGTVGFSVFHWEAPPPVRDSDGDGVPDGPDQCPGTPAGAIVDSRGCPLDGDRDAVFDGLDKCPDTPTGATVDAAGCPADADGDRVYDGIDQCPDTPPGASVNALGCPADEDADRVPDGVDQCPGTPMGAVVDPRGCPTDSDGDGVYDGIDQCPNTPPGAAVDERGCQTEVVQVAPDTLPKDSDGDGVVDGVDRCPGTPRGSQVDQFGCIILFREEAGEKATPLVLRGVNFASGRSILTPASFAILDQVAASLLANPDVRIEIAGHTDDTGAEAMNLRLSQARARAVQHYLANKGVALERMVARGYGETEPVATNATPQGKAQNRRVELRRIN